MLPLESTVETTYWTNGHCQVTSSISETSDYDSTSRRLSGIYCNACFNVVIHDHVEEKIISLQGRTGVSFYAQPQSPVDFVPLDLLSRTNILNAMA